MKATVLTNTTDPATITMTGYRQSRWTPGWVTEMTVTMDDEDTDIEQRASAYHSQLRNA